MAKQCSAPTRFGPRCLNHAEVPGDTCRIHSGLPILTVYQKIARAADKRLGVTLTPSDVWALYRDRTVKDPALDG